MHESVMSKIIDIVLDLILRFFVYVLKVISPIVVSPKEVIASAKQTTDGWGEIRNIKIQNRMASDLFDVYVVGMSKEPFDIKMISDDGPKVKNVEHMNINTNHLIVVGNLIPSGTPSGFSESKS